MMRLACIQLLACAETVLPGKGKCVEATIWFCLEMCACLIAPVFRLHPWRLTYIRHCVAIKRTTRESGHCWPQPPCPPSPHPPNTWTDTIWHFFLHSAISIWNDIYAAAFSSESPAAFKWSLRAHLHMVGMFQCMSDINQPSLPTSFYFVLASVSISVAHSTVFHSIDSPDNSTLSSSILLVLFLPYWSFQLSISLWKSSALTIHCGWLGSKHQLTN